MAALSWDAAMAKYNPKATPLSITGNTTPNDTGLTVDGGGGFVEFPSAAPPAAPPPDPYAQWGGQAKFNALQSGFNTQDSTIHSSANDSANIAASQRHSSIIDFLDSLRSSQKGIDEQGVQNELAKKQGFNSIMGVVGRGLKSGGTILANRNALSSSAAQAIAMAYGDLGRRDMNEVGNQYELKNRDIGLSQDNLNQSKASNLRKFGESEQAGVTNIVSQAHDKLAALDAQMAGANMPQRIAIEQEKQQIQGQVQGILGQYDSELNNGANGVQAASRDTNRSTAFGLANAGVAATNPFDFTEAAQTQTANNSPFSELPLFSALPGSKKRIA